MLEGVIGIGDGGEGVGGEGVVGLGGGGRRSRLLSSPNPVGKVSHGDLQLFIGSCLLGCLGLRYIQWWLVRGSYYISCRCDGD